MKIQQLRLQQANTFYSVSASKLLFDGFLSVYKSEEDKEDGNTLINGVNKDIKLGLIQVLPETALYSATSTFYRSISCKEP